MLHPTIQFLDHAIARFIDHSLENGSEPHILMADVLSASPKVMERVRALILDLKGADGEITELDESHVLWFLAEMQHASNALAFHQFANGEAVAGEELTN